MAVALLAAYSRVRGGAWCSLVWNAPASGLVSLVDTVIILVAAAHITYPAFS